MDFNNHIFHYTNASALIQIVRTRKLWATQIEYMNDSREGSLAKQHLRNILPSYNLDEYVNKVFDRFLSIGRQAYITAFSPRYDNLSLYRTYGPSHGGYCIGFGKSYLTEIPLLNLIDCEYSLDTQRESIHLFIKEMISTIDKHRADFDLPIDNALHIERNYTFFDRLSNLSVSHKSAEFVTEEEVRLVSNNWSGRDLRVSSLGHVIIPYVEIDLPNEKIDVLITLGPNTNHKLATQGIQEIHHIAKKEGCNWDIAVGTWELSGFRTL